MEAKGYTQTSLSLEIDVSPAAVGKWQRGESVPNRRTMMRISDFFKIPYDVLRDNTQQISIDESFKSSKNIPQDVAKIKDDLEKIISLRNNLNETISEIVALLEKQISCIKKF